MKAEQWLFKMNDEDYIPQSRFIIGKYGPGQIEQGYYTSNDWISHAEIGEKFAGRVFTEQEYLRVENNYVSCARALALAHGCNYLTEEDSKRVGVTKIDPIITGSLRNNNQTTLYNVSKSFMLTVENNYLFSIRSNKTREEIEALVERFGLHLLPLLSNASLKEDSLVSKWLDENYRPLNRYSIIKYNPAYYINGVYTKNEWTSFFDIGNTFDNFVLTLDEYLIVENRYIACAKQLAAESGCSYLSVAYMEGNGRFRVKTANGKRRDLIPGSKLAVKDIDDALRNVLRENYVWMVFLNVEHSFMIDFGYDYYMHIRCPLQKARVESIVASHQLHLDPRNNNLSLSGGKRFFGRAAPSE